MLNNSQQAQGSNQSLASYQIRFNKKAFRLNEKLPAESENFQRKSIIVKNIVAM